MKLREFSLWAYKLELNDSRAFTLENRCVCAHFERHFKSLEEDNIYRVVIKLGEPDQRDGTTEESSSVLKFYSNFDFDHFYKLKGIERKEFLLSTLYTALLKVCELKVWDIEPFKQAYRRVIEDKFDNSYEVSTKNNRARSMAASLNAQHTEEQFNLVIIVKNNDGKVIFERQVLSEEPDEFLFNGQIGNLKWTSNDILTYIAKDKSVIETMNLSPNG
ncbi:hypothetical protein PC2016_3264 [Pseudoalteromonas carrageenovora]|uniref:Uncharacterized protein n=1 Tax=Pseudoalteromonas carrageenovora IAM 12662 TaxID=1314868 RepID=A0A2K4XFL8_PSEVC|nr:hypothetical protein [Pseudoalteromonas carrageenovora]MBE0384733.1 hypothetical protein [Pseudoalteromonas carrageenovora IAM 12662]QBJ73446.1 hypothetical protein PC2016_3264 [Pseudoalteromonas carrageenovora]GEB70292.1 hypothetical protein PCA01_10020 [Pseudoalteromonas carrageenovora]SOU43112.1 conserved protein of unknown function [Pseudoalteromonas carrageenovora IAM 12662]